MPYSDPNKQRQYQREWRAKRRADFFKNKRCARCGSTDNLELDHVDPKSKLSNAIWSWSEKRRLIEIAKCQILCTDCHKSKTFNEDPRPKTGHGKRRLYQLGCRCDPCTTAKRLDNARRYQ